MIILYLHDYDTEVHNFIDSNKFGIESTDPTKKYQAEIRKKLKPVQTNHSQQPKMEIRKHESEPTHT